MELSETGEVVTPLDDPCQFNPAWRSIVAGHLFTAGVRDKEDLDSIARFGCITVRITVMDDGVTPVTRKKGKGALRREPRKKPYKQIQKNVRRKIEPCKKIRFALYQSVLLQNLRNFY